MSRPMSLCTTPNRSCGARTVEDPQAYNVAVHRLAGCVRSTLYAAIAQQFCTPTSARSINHTFYSVHLKGADFRNAERSDHHS